MTRTISETSSSQLVDRLLCSECEDRFNKNGEQYVLSWLSPRKAAQGSFPLFERLQLALPLHSSPTLNAYRADSVGIDTAKFGYFALSVLWRGAVQRWRMPDGTLTQKIDLGELEEPLRKYLISDGNLPSEFVLILTVCSDRESRQTLYPPALRRDAKFRAYGILLLGIHFNITIERDLPHDVRRLCCMRGPHRPLFLRDCRDDTFRAFSALASTSRPTGNLKRSLND